MKESVFKTFGVTIAVCFVCSVFVAAAAVMLKPMQEQNQRLDIKKNILSAAGLIDLKGTLPSPNELEKMFDEKIKQVVINLETGEAVEKGDYEEKDLDIKAAVNGKVASDPIDPKSSSVGIKARPKFVTIYYYEEAGKVERVIFPIVGKGLWSTMYGFIVLKDDYNTISTIIFYDQGETAGLGGEIANPKWQAKWSEKHVYNENGEMIRVVRGNANPANPNIDVMVDGIGGSTLTCNGVTNTVHYWLGENGFGPYIEKMKSEQTKE